MCAVKWKTLKGSWPKTKFQIWVFTLKRPVVGICWVFSPHLFHLLEWGPNFVLFLFFWRTTIFFTMLCVLVKLTPFHSGFSVGCDLGLANQSLTLAYMIGMGASPNQSQREAIWDFCWACEYTLATGLFMGSCKPGAAGSHFPTTSLHLQPEIKASQKEGEQGSSQ